MSTYAPGAPDQVWALTGLDAGAKLTLLRLWSWADHNIQREPVETTVWAAGRLREDGSKMGAAEALQLTLAEGTGQTARAVRSHLTRLRVEGLADADGRCVRLTPPRQACRSSVDTNPSGPDTTASAVDTKPSGPDTKPSGNYTPKYPANTQPEPPTAGEPAPVEGHTCSVADSPEVTHASVDAPPSRARKRKAAKPRQQGLPIPDEIVSDDPLEVAHAEILALHERLRTAAYAHHGERMPAWPAPFTDAGRTIRTGLRQALRDHGPEACRRVLDWQAAGWKRDSTKLKNSLATMWSADVLAWAVPKSAGQAPARASPSRGLPVDADAPDRTYHWE